MEVPGVSDEGLPTLLIAAAKKTNNTFRIKEMPLTIQQGHHADKLPQSYFYKKIHMPKWHVITSTI